MGAPDHRRSVGCSCPGSILATKAPANQAIARISSANPPRIGRTLKTTIWTTLAVLALMASSRRRRCCNLLVGYSRAVMCFGIQLVRVGALLQRSGRTRPATLAHSRRHTESRQYPRLEHKPEHQKRKKNQNFHHSKSLFYRFGHIIAPRFHHRKRASRMFRRGAAHWKRGEGNVRLPSRAVRHTPRTEPVPFSNSRFQSEIAT